ncbi:putative toxin-antitoxin system toxin component, PIN family [Candidatus Methylomirabilis limnetica]|jgi:putative PIN family toxin of toxin-antitoxin system|uniref:Putative toxin-antitoxin system toxin component, PIN family n=1 Tax=Candidatus Methylomirabilis limnetica TaxID=2033718 RepID=A0A2T4TX17_9BACT|nr:putative toxin-antitoxin system toxin component, PIN family [Candidatus Methylomirabilis limnetica]PTL35658.1 putative toxin-antitoxin system toxin component, PIN family [Candidatus Methylomirabilis limnetica]
MTRAVLDANVLVGAILSPKGTPAKVLTAWQAEQFHLVLSEAVLDEIDRVLRYPRIARRHGWSEERLQALSRISPISRL